MKNIKNFYYISENKMDVLEPQLSSGISLSGLRPRIELSGFSLEMEIEASEPPSSKVRRLLKLLRKLKKSKLLNALSSASSLDRNSYYADQALWYHGLFSFSDDVDHTRVVTYLLWRFWRGAILLLVGSPLNILGERTVREGVTCHGTSVTFNRVHQFADRLLRTDEPSMIYVSDREDSSLPSGEPTITKASWAGLAFQEESEPVPVQLTAAPSALALGVLCVRYLVRLPQESIDTVLKPYKKLTFRKPADLPRWVRELCDVPDLDRRQMHKLHRCKTIYVGSPLYTALV